MANAIYTVVLDVTDNGCIDTGWRLHQGDYGESQVVVKVVNNGVNMFDASILPQITFKRSDGISIVGEMFIEDSTYKYNFVGNELEVPGIVLMDVKLIDSQGRTSTAASRFIVLPNPEGDTQEGSHTYINSGLVSELRENAQIAVESAATSIEEALVSEGWANGEQNGEPVEQGSPYYHNNAKYWSQQSNPTRFGSLSDVDFGILRDDDIPVYDATSEKWVNEVGVSTEIKNASVVSGETKIRTRTGGILQSCGVKLDPVQDLHGYSKPWVGGSGKNKLPLVLSDIKTLNTAGTWNDNIYTYDAVTFEVKTDNDGNVTEIVVNGASTGTRTFYLSKSILLTDNTSYTLTGCPTGGSNSTFRLSFYNGADVVSHKGETDGVTINYTETSGNEVGAYIRVYNQYQLNNLSFKPMIRLATETSATFEPYTNICSISGHDEIAINNDPKNWIPYIEDGDLNVTTGAEEPTANTRRSGFIAIDRTKRYVISGFNVGMSGAQIKFCYYNADKTFKGGDVINISQGQDVYFSSFSSGTAYIRFAASSSVITNKMQAEIGTVSTAYDPYREPEQTTIDIDSTVYGGNIDVVSGSGKSKYIDIDLSAQTWSYNSASDRKWFTCTVSDVKATPNYQIADMYCECYEPSTRNDIIANPSADSLIAINTAKNIIIRDLRFTDPTDLVNALSGMHLIAERDTYNDASCTPTPVETLPNTNVMYAPSDGQTLMSAEYREAFAWSDVKSAIAHALAALT